MKKIPIAKPTLGEEEIQAAGDVIRSGWVTQGPKVAEFEQQFASYVGAKHACATSSCTTALHLALLAIGVRPGDVVLTVSHSFIATANAIRHCGAEPVFIDIEPNTFNISVSALEKCLNADCEVKGSDLVYKKADELAAGESPLTSQKKIGRVAGILIVHQIGMPCDLKGVLGLAKKYSLPVVEDAACAIGSEISLDDGKTWEKIGKSHGDIACFSFHPRKIITTGDGGMLTTNNAQYDEQFRLLRHQGMGVSDLERHSSSKMVIENYVTTGFNYRMTDIQAAIGIEQLKKLPQMLEKRKEIAEYYEQALKDVDWLQTYHLRGDVKWNWQSYPVTLKENAPRNAAELMNYLLENSVSSRPGVMNSHEELPYKNVAWKLPVSEKTRAQTVLLPLFDSLEKSDLVRIVNVLKEL